MPESLKDGPLWYKTGLACQRVFYGFRAERTHLDQTIPEGGSVEEHMNDDCLVFGGR